MYPNEKGDKRLSTQSEEEGREQSQKPNRGSVDSYQNFYPDGGREAWTVLLGCFCTYFSSLAMMNSLGSYQARVSAYELRHESVEKIGWIFGFYSFLTFFAGIQMGPWFDAKGPKFLSALGSVFLLATYMLLGVCREYWQFFLVFGLLGGLASALLYSSAIGTVQHWFFARRGLATGLVVSGGSLGGILFPPILERLFPYVGFAWATRIIGLVLFPFPLIGTLLMKSRFSNYSGERFILPDLSMLAFPRMAIITAGIFFIELGIFIPLTYISSYALSEGISTAVSYQLLTFLNIGSLLGRWIPGYLADKIGRLNTLVIANILCTISIFGLWFPAGNNVASLVAFAIIFGFASGSNLSVTPVCVGELCETEKYGSFFAAACAVSSFGPLTGIPIGGSLITACQGKYWGIITFGGVTYGIGLVCFLTIRVLQAK